MRVLIAPYAATLPSGTRNPKNWPWFTELVAQLNAEGHEVLQIGTANEAKVEGVAHFIQDWPLSKLAQLACSCDTWVSVDSFWPHYCHTHHLLSGIVIWGQSDPRIWGHPENVNLIKDRKYLRQFQYAPWWDATYNEDAFVSLEIVLTAIHGKLVTLTQVA